MSEKHRGAAVAALLLAVCPLAAQPQGQPKQPPQPMSFFVTSTGVGNGANLGGLAGADAHCQKLAEAASAGNKTWHAYLSTQAAGVVPGAVADAVTRIDGRLIARGARVAASVADLHGDTIEAARLGNNVSKASAFTEKNESIKGFGDQPNQHDILTGSLPDGRAYSDGADHTCKNWTSGSDGTAQLGHFDRTGGGNTSWNSAHPSRGCSQENLVSTGGAGLLYCFAIN